MANQGFGIIVPVGEFRKKVETVALRCAEKPDIHKKLLDAMNSGKADLPFLASDNEYNPYFLQKMSEYKTNPPPKPSSTDPAEKKNITDTLLDKELDKHDDDSSSKKRQMLLKDPHPDHYMLPLNSVNATIPRLELEIMKRTALYAAKLGGTTLFDTMKAKGAVRGSPFEFLEPEHIRHKTYMSLRQGYERVLEFSEEVETELERDEKGSLSEILAICEEKKEFVVSQRQRDRAQRLSEPELMQRLMWSPFVVGARLSLKELGLEKKAVAAPVPVVEDYVASGRGLGDDGSKMVRDSKTGQILSVESATEHLKTSGIAPKTAEDRMRAEKRLREESGALADDDEVERNLAQKFGKTERGKVQTFGAALDD